MVTTHIPHRYIRCLFMLLAFLPPVVMVSNNSQVIKRGMVVEGCISLLIYLGLQKFEAPLANLAWGRERMRRMVWCKELIEDVEIQIWRHKHERYYVPVVHSESVLCSGVGKEILFKTLWHQRVAIVIKVLTSEAQGLKFRPQHPCKKSDVVTMPISNPCMGRRGGAEAGRSLETIGHPV